MIRLNFYRQNGHLSGFTIKGHAGYADSGDDIVCASVSSAVMLVSNTITEVFKINADIKVLDNEIRLTLLNDIDGNGEKLLDGLLLHINTLSEDFEGTTKITFSEV